MRWLWFRSADPVLGTDERREVDEDDGTLMANKFGDVVPVIDTDGMFLYTEEPYVSLDGTVHKNMSLKGYIREDLLDMDLTAVKEETERLDRLATE